jgi:hypothetical protein
MQPAAHEEKEEEEGKIEEEKCTIVERWRARTEAEEGNVSISKNLQRKATRDGRRIISM